MITLKYLRTLDFEDLVKEYNYYRNHQLKWGSILEEYYNQNIKDKNNYVREKVDYYTKIINKISKIMVEKGG